LDRFLDEMSKMYEIVIFSAGLPYVTTTHAAGGSYI